MRASDSHTLGSGARRTCAHLHSSRPRSSCDPRRARPTGGRPQRRRSRADLTSHAAHRRGSRAGGELSLSQLGRASYSGLRRASHRHLAYLSREAPSLVCVHIELLSQWLAHCVLYGHGQVGVHVGESV